jgi:hypothetical protein
VKVVEQVGIDPRPVVDRHGYTPAGWIGLEWPREVKTAALFPLPNPYAVLRW